MVKTKKALACLIMSLILFAYSFSSASALSIGISGCSNGGSFCFSLGNGGGTGGGWDPNNYGAFGLPGGSIIGILGNILLWILAIFGIIGIIAFVIAGIIYLTSAGDEDRIGLAKKAMTYAIIGIVVGLSGFIILQAISFALQANSVQY